MGIRGELLLPLLQFFLPAACPGCGTPVTAGGDVCPVCIESFTQLTPSQLNSEYSRKFSQHQLVDTFYAPYLFEQDKPLQKIVHAFKYGQKPAAAVKMGSLLGIKLVESGLIDSGWTIVPVPLHRQRIFVRGYNQSAYLAEGIEKVTGVAVNTKLVRRLRNTKTQTNLTIAQRKENIKGAFTVQKKSVPVPAKILLLDDVITTGATIEECAVILRDAGATQIIACALALAEFQETTSAPEQKLPV